MTFKIISNTCGSLQQACPEAVGGGSLCNTIINSQHLQQHQLLAGAGQHQCTRFCCFEPLFGNVFRCQASDITHICDQGCTERIFLDNHYDICRCVACIWSCTHLQDVGVYRLADTNHGLHALRHTITSSLTAVSCACRFSKKLFPTQKQPDTSSRKRCLDDSNIVSLNNKRANVMTSCLHVQ